MLEYEIFEGNFQTLLSRCVLGKTFLPLFLCHCLDTNTGEVGIAPRTAAIAVLTSQTVAEELDYLRTSTAKLRLPMQTPSSRSQKAATKHAIRRYFYSFFLVVFDFTFFFPLPLFYASAAALKCAAARRHPLRGAFDIGKRSQEEEALMTSFGIYDLCTDFFRFAFLPASSRVKKKKTSFVYLGSACSYCNDHSRFFLGLVCPWKGRDLLCSCLMARSHNGLGLDFVDGGKLDLLLLKHIVHEQVTTTSTNTTTSSSVASIAAFSLLTDRKDRKKSRGPSRNPEYCSSPPGKWWQKSWAVRCATLRSDTKQAKAARGLCSSSSSSEACCFRRSS